MFPAHTKRPLLSSNPSTGHLFPTSRPIRPFASIANSVTRTSLNGGSNMNGTARKPVKIIEPSKKFKSEFVLNLTQAELSRQD
ncbi:hypothetical protein PHLCEN_2v12789 [Hermanssonia centrifuga]|uniref:Uncharacterized protein n=1 Tax=Hermanssonia centrifuga TaxID=98765 RepID=A0A2R6NFW0_9APHY|nr:hypothetical protein PHLCEN_2v12789 [Hermanssonia centrifuga]